MTILGAYWHSTGSGGGAAPADYTHLTGFQIPAVRIDPHTHIVAPKNETGLLTVVELIRPRVSGPTTPSPASKLTK